MMIAYVIYAKKKILTLYKDIDNEKVLEKLEAFIEGSNHKTFHATMMNVYFLDRRFSTGMVLIFLHEYPGLQVTCLMLFALVNFMYTVIALPYLENNLTEILNELAVLLCAYLMNTFL